MKNKRILGFLVLAVLLAGAKVASGQWVGVTPTPTPVPQGVLNGAVHSDGKNANGVEQSTEKGTNGSENGNKVGVTMK